MELQIKGLKIDAGEGSKGGHVIGHTTSGKPIYAAGNRGNAGRDWKHSDHAEAAKAHSNEIKKLREKMDDLGRHANYHDRMSKQTKKTPIGIHKKQAAPREKALKNDSGTGHIAMAPPPPEGNIEPEKRKKKKKVLGGASNPATGTQSGNGGSGSGNGGGG